MALTDIVLFKFETKEIRCINIGDDAWFALTDVLAGMKSSTKLTDAKASVIEAFGDEGVKNLPMFDAVGRFQLKTGTLEMAGGYHA
jgi:prophage antirepressor-like protein